MKIRPLKMYGTLLVLASVVSCAARQPEDQVVQKFMEDYYVKTDLKSAQALTDGLAYEKVATSRKLTEGYPVDGSTRHPEVNVQLLERAVSDEGADYLFRVTIEPPDFQRMVKRSRVRLRKRESGWKVTQFADSEVLSAPSE